jgi:hypothetical protein
VIVAAVFVVVVLARSCNLYYLRHSEHKKKNLCNNSRSRTLDIRVLIA